jgi:hypothetical protein
MCLTTPYTKEIVGISQFSNGLGIINLSRGFGGCLGPYIGGFFTIVMILRYYLY